MISDDGSESIPMVGAIVPFSPSEALSHFQVTSFPLTGDTDIIEISRRRQQSLMLHKEVEIHQKIAGAEILSKNTRDKYTAKQLDIR